MKPLIILDIQNDFTGPDAKFPVNPAQAEEIIKNINKLTADIKNNGLTPVYIGNEFSKNDWLNIFRNFSAIKGSEGCKIDNRLNVVNNIYFAKNKSSAFVNGAFKSFLVENKVKELYITGLYADACVWATTKEALKSGYRVTILRDGVATRTAEKRVSMVEKYKKAGVNIITSRMIEGH